MLDDIVLPLKRICFQLHYIQLEFSIFNMQYFYLMWILIGFLAQKININRYFVDPLWEMSDLTLLCLAGCQTVVVGAYYIDTLPGRTENQTAHILVSWPVYCFHLSAEMVNFSDPQLWFLQKRIVNALE